ncbi:MAG TPA: glucosaminidase domain-containing protein [Ktedonosporobacter sp.]|nr:glucosaminidase domain-containing protein [Ktedonosporobacter sp.]
MASGSYAKKPTSQLPLEVPAQIPLRATRQLPSLSDEEDESEPEALPRSPKAKRAVQAAVPQEKPVTSLLDDVAAVPGQLNRIINEFRPRPLDRHQHWLRSLLIMLVCVVIAILILLSSSIIQRPGSPQLVGYGGMVYNAQVGGTQANSWQSNEPIPSKVPLPTNPGPYAVLSKPTISVDFINQVLASYQSPAAGKGQALYDLGVKYQIDPAFALAFFLHESTMGTAGEARTTLSLGNLRCIPNAACINMDGTACQKNQSCYAAFPTWEAGFEAWYKLIRNLYVAQWGLTTIDQIIPTYAPNSDNNNESGYISSLKHYIDTWHAGQIRP